MFKVFENILAELRAMNAIQQEKVKQLNGINAGLLQIYGEINRLRLIAYGVTAKERQSRARNIESFDAKVNKYYPFFDNRKNYEKYDAYKSERKVKPSKR